MCVGHVYTEIVLCLELHLQTTFTWMMRIIPKNAGIFPTFSLTEHWTVPRSNEVPRNNNYWSPPRFWRVQCRCNSPLCCPLRPDSTRVNTGHPHPASNDAFPWWRHDCLSAGGTKLQLHPKTYQKKLISYQRPFGGFPSVPDFFDIFWNLSNIQYLLFLGGAT